ncbi:MAG: PQQ-binding-like beta-propeller repeat protein [Planctomycetaceae bacterium]
MKNSLGIPIFLVLWLITCDVIRGENWPRFRGPSGQGISSETDLPVTWSMNENIKWTSDLPGQGWSSPIVFKDHIFLTAATEEGVSCRVICINRKDGSIAWSKEVHRQKPGPMRKQNSYATPTPVTDGKLVYSVFYDGTVIAVDFLGNIVWKNNEVRFFSLHGLGASPILANGQIIMPFDGSSREETQVGWKVPWEKAVILSLDAEDGSVRWKGSRGKSRVGHVTPILVDDDKQLISAGGDRVQGFDPNTGERIWSIYSQGEGVTPSPVVGDGLLYTSSGFEAPTLRAIRLGGKGEVTNSHIAWEQKNGVAALASLLYVKQYLYSISRDNILHCLDAATGDIVWRERLTGTYSASPIYADGRIYILSAEGETLVLRPGAKYDEIARNDISDTCNASMAISQGNFYIRSAKKLYCIGK